MNAINIRWEDASDAPHSSVPTTPVVHHMWNIYMQHFVYVSYSRSGSLDSIWVHHPF